MGKVTMQDIADSLDISRVTVWKVFNNQKGVSQSLKDQVISKAREMGYIIENYPSNNSSLANKNIALVVSRPDSSTFWTSIIHSIAKELSCNDINMLYTYIPSEYSNGYNLPNTLNPSNIDGCIIINIYDSKIYEMLNALKVPKVFLDITPDFELENVTGDVFLIEGLRTEYSIVNSLINKGISNIGFLGDIEYAKTNLDRFNGYKACLQDHSIMIPSKYVHSGKIGINSYYEELSAYLDSLDLLPEAFVCVSDYIIHFIINYFNEHETKLKKPLYLTGFDGTDEYANVDRRFTTAYVNTEMLGKRLAMQLKYRLTHPNAPTENIYINPEILYRESILTKY